MRLAHPDGPDRRAGAQARARQGTAIVDISGGLHASEIAGSQHTPQLAYELLSRAERARDEGDPRQRRVLPLAVDQSRRPGHRRELVPGARRMFGQRPRRWSCTRSTSGHDNNRDCVHAERASSRASSSARGASGSPTSSTCSTSRRRSRRASGFRRSPIPSASACRRSWRARSTPSARASPQELDAHGKPGAVHQLDTYDAWYPGYIDYMPMYQNIPAWWTETQGGNCATPRTTTRDSLPASTRTCARRRST